MISLLQLILHGTVGSISSQATSADILEILGDPDIHTPARKSYPEMIVYGDLEFRLKGNKLRVVTLSLGKGKPQLPNNITVVDTPDKADVRSIEELLRKNQITFEQDPIMSDEEQDVIITQNRVHLVFVDQELVRIGVEFPFVNGV